MAKNESAAADKNAIAVKKIPFVDLYLVKGAEKRRGEAEFAALKKSRDLRNKVTARLLHENLVLKRRLARWEGR